MNERAGNLVIVAAPSGGGKTSLVKELIKMLPRIEVSISHTTRAMRPGEKEGLDYFFVDDEHFFDMVKANAFIEHAQVYNHSYGTSKKQISTRLSAGIDVVLDIDWQGAKQIKDIFPEAISVFIIPPSLEILKERLKARGQDKEDIIQYRMTQAKSELSHFAEFDYLIVNDDFAKAADELRSIVLANRLKLSSQNELQGKLLPFLLASQ